MSKSVLIGKLAVLATVLGALQLATEPAADRLFTPDAIEAARGLVPAMPAVLYFGDSTIEPLHPNVPGAATTPVLLARELTGYEVGEFAHAGYTLIDYAGYLEYFLRRDVGPRFAVVPINLRSFSPTWDANPGMQFERERLFARHDSFLFRAWFKPMATYGVFSLTATTESAYRATPFFDGTTPIGVMSDLPQLAHVPADPEVISMTIRALYAGSVPEDHRLLAALRDLIRSTRGSGTRLVLYMTPVDYTTGDAYLDGAFSEYLRRRAALVERVVLDEDGEVLDYSRLYGPEFFRTGYYYAEEHLTDAGREGLAALLAGRIRAYGAPRGGADAF